jgi:hypothetical protein
LIAIAISSPGLRCTFSVAKRSVGQTDRLFLKTAGWVLAAFSAIVCSFTFYFLIDPGLNNHLVWLWLSNLILAGCTLWIFDKQRGTRFGRLFDSRTELTIVIAVMAVCSIVGGYDLTSWRWAGTPDEAHFFVSAKTFGIRCFNDRFILSETGVFGYHPVLSTAYQIAFMRTFGMNILGWKLSSLAALIFSLPFIYILCRELWSYRAGILAALFFGSTRLAVGFAHFGYNNEQVYLPVMISLGIFAVAVKRRSLLGYFMAGCIAGLGFHTYYPARLAPILVCWLGFSLQGMPIIKAGRLRTFFLIAGMIMVAFPIIVHPGEMIAHMLQQTAVTGGKQIGESQIHGFLRTFLASSGIFPKMLLQWFVTIIYGIQYKDPSHFQHNPIMDPISCALAFIGLFLAARSTLAGRCNWFILPAFLFSAFVNGALSPYYRPPLTRLLFLSPFMAIFSAVALDYISLRLATDEKRWRYLGTALPMLLVFSSIAWNVISQYDHIRHHSHGYGDGTTSELIRIARTLPVNCAMIYVQHKDTYMECSDMVMDEFGMGSRIQYIKPLDERFDKALQIAAPPLAVFCNLTNEEQFRRVQGSVSERFPEPAWQDSDPGHPWNLKYVYIPGPI